MSLTAGGAVIAAAPFSSPSLPGLDRMTAASPSSQDIKLFNGRDLSDWEHFLVEDGAKMDDVWSEEDGILVCKREPACYLATKGEYENFKLVVEWRWAEEPGNSGVLMRIAGELAMLPSSEDYCISSSRQTPNSSQ